MLFIYSIKVYCSSTIYVSLETQTKQESLSSVDVVLSSKGDKIN